MEFIGKALIIDDVVPGRYAVSSDGKLFDFKYNRIINGHRWKHITSKYNLPEKKSHIFLDINKVRQICTMFSNDYTIKEVSDMLSIPYSTIASIRQKVSHKEISDNYF